MEILGVAVVSEGKVVEVAKAPEEHFDKVARFMLNRWHGAENLQVFKCKIILEEEVRMS